jgi:DDE superfamily endonuclease
LAAGDSIYSLHIAYRIGISTIYKFIPKVCASIWSALRHTVITPINNSNLERLATEFYSKWDLPNCVGALDGKHVRIKAPRNSGSKFFNYKSYYSIVLLALCDASYKFTYVDIGAYGSQHDSGIFSGSSLSQMIRSQKIGNA